MGYYDEITDGAKLVATHEREVRALEKQRVKFQEELARHLLTARGSKQERRAAVTPEFKRAVEEHGLRLREIFGAARVREKALSRGGRGSREGEVRHPRAAGRVHQGAPGDREAAGRRARQLLAPPERGT